ncbi:MAG TPA: GAF domain-containing protein [Anaerolineales bacterium]|nr:GAF domain-containing protein [Anaerolineales bacterium]HLO28267.1 GAF domain-containing protein [Anaerolineales bacterium]
MNANPLSNDQFFITAYFSTSGNALQLVQYSDPVQTTIPRGIELSLSEMESFFHDGPVQVDLRTASSLPPPLGNYTRQLGCETAAYVPILQKGKLRGFVLIGARPGQWLDEEVVNAFSRTIWLTANSLETSLSQTEPLNDRRSVERKAIDALASNAANVDELRTFYILIHDQVRSVVGNYGFVIATYDQRTNSISIPYLYEDNAFSSIDTFPLGEGLTSVLIRTHEPLMLVEDTEKRAIAMGAKIAGKPAMSWLGVPLLARGEAIGALIIQDVEHEHSFDEDDLHFMVSVANQVSGAIHTVRLINESKQAAIQFETTAEIARDISSSLELDELLQKAVELIKSRFDFYHAGIFLKDLPGEFVVIREATGEAGAQMKRSGHKLSIGSKSVVGFVASKGEPLIVNDTARDATYYANPLLPETRAEAAIPLKVGDRIVGVLDVQSNQAYAFSDENLRTLQILADQLAIAVVNTELFAETQEHLAQHRLLHHITTTAASGTTLREALQSAVDGLQVTLGGDRVSILLADREKKILEVKAAVGYASDVFDLHISIGSGITGWVAAHRRTLRVNNVLQDTRYIEGSSNTRSEMAIPLVYRSELLGVLNVESEQFSAYAENDEELLGTLGGSLAAIIANARLLEQIRAQAERERILFEISDKIRRTTDIETILTTTASELTRAVGATGARIKVGVTPSNANRKSKANHD